MPPNPPHSGAGHRPAKEENPPQCPGCVDSYNPLRLRGLRRRWANRRERCIVTDGMTVSFTADLRSDDCDLAPGVDPDRDPGVALGRDRHSRGAWDATASTARAKRPTPLGERLPAGSSTTNAAVPGKRWFSQPTTLPGSRLSWTRRNPTRSAKRSSIARLPPDLSTTSRC